MSEAKIIKENDKLRKQLEREIERSKKPGECLKLISVLIDDELAEIGNSSCLKDNICNNEGPIYELIDTLSNNTYFPCPKSIRWMVKRQNVQFINNSWSIETNYLFDDIVVMIVTGEDFINLIKGTWENNKIRDIQSLISVLDRDQLKLTMIIMNVEHELLKLNNSSKKSQVKISSDIVESTILDLNLLNNICIWRSSNYAEAAKIVSGYTKSVAERDFKMKEKMRSSGGLFSLSLTKVGAAGAIGAGESRGQSESAGSTASCCRVHHVCDVGTLGGVDQLWRIQLTQFRGVTADMAEAIQLKYPTPLVLYEHLLKYPKEKEAINQIADIEIRRGTGYLSTSRRIGKEIASRIYHFLTTTDTNITVF